MFLQKTFKRELAAFCVLMLIVMAVFAILSGTVELLQARLDVVKTLITPVFLFAATAFGMDWITKQTHWGGPPAGQRRDGETE